MVDVILRELKRLEEEIQLLPLEQLELDYQVLEEMYEQEKHEPGWAVNGEDVFARIEQLRTDIDSLK